MFVEFYRPATIQEAVKLKKEHPSSVFMAGGTEVNSKGWCDRRPGAPVIDRAIGIAHLQPGGFRQSPAGLEIAATTTVQALIDRPESPPLLSEAARQFANRNIRNMATIGGNIGACKSCSNLIPSLLALDARLRVASEKGDEEIPLGRYMESPDPDILILAVVIPGESPGRWWATRKHSRTVNDISIISVAVTFIGDSSKLLKPIIAVGGVAARVIRLPGLEGQLEGKALPSRDEIEAMAKPLMFPVDDLRGSGEYKRHVAAVLVAWALHSARPGKGGRS
jgi:probable selenate reductase FAD-binding subunit